MTTTTALEVPVQPVNHAAVVEAALRAIYSVYGPSDDFTFTDFAQAIRGNAEAKKELEDLLHTVASGEDEDDVLHAFGLGMVSGILYAASTGITLKVPPLKEVKAALDAQQARDEAMTKAAPGAPQAV
jgi:hypothetical protein